MMLADAMSSDVSNLFTLPDIGDTERYVCAVADSVCEDEARVHEKMASTLAHCCKWFESGFRIPDELSSQFTRFRVLLEDRPRGLERLRRLIDERSVSEEASAPAPDTRRRRSPSSTVQRYRLRRQ